MARLTTDRQEAWREALERAVYGYGRLHEKEMRNYWGTWIVSYLGYLTK
jgi:hypothetical protein